MYCDARLTLGLRVPADMRWTYAEDTYRLAMARYVPQPFPGRVVLVTGKVCGADYREKWGRIALGDFTLHEVCSRNHLDLVTDEQTIAQWADLLSRHMKSPGESLALPSALCLPRMTRIRRGRRVLDLAESPKRACAGTRHGRLCHLPQRHFGPQQ